MGQEEAASRTESSGSNLTEARPPIYVRTSAPAIRTHPRPRVGKRQPNFDEWLCRVPKVEGM